MGALVHEPAVVKEVAEWVCMKCTTRGRGQGIVLRDGDRVVGRWCSRLCFMKDVGLRRVG